MSDYSDIDDTAHEQLLKSISTGKVIKSKPRRTAQKVTSDDLLGSLKTVKTATTEAKKALAGEKKEAKKVGATKTLAPPIHRRQRERIQGAVGFTELKKDLGVWREVVESNRLQEQLVFPLHQERVLNVETAADKTDSFVPKTDMEKEMAAVLNNSKHNLKNDTVYTEAELEIIKAMNLQEAKQKLAEMQKMRALVSYREAKYRYAKKIKSKGYHRILKREKRKQLVKEFDELLVRDPEAAKEKLAELETMRILERGSLRHHARSKFQQTIMKHAGKDPEAKKILEEHLRLGRELKNKAGLESESEESEAEKDKPTSVGDLIKSAALAAAAAEEEKEAGPSFNDAESRQHLYEMRAKKRCEIAKSKMMKDGTLGKAPVEKVFDENSDWTVVTADSTQPASEELPSDVPKKKKLKKKKKKATAEEETPTAGEQNIDELFESAEKQLIDKYRKEAEELRNEEAETDEPKKKKKKKAASKEEKPAKKAEERPIDISLDPKNFLQMETSNIAKVSSDLMDAMDKFDEDQERLVAEAFKDDDVIGQFEEEKEFIEEGERPKDVDLTLQGWGCWVGPGMTERKRRKQFIIKAKEKRRRDQGKAGVIMKEIDNGNIEKLQPRNLPFPYTRVEDFQAVMMQPIGKDYNPISVTNKLCKPAVVTQGGRAIRPLDKKEAIKKRVYESEEED